MVASETAKTMSMVTLIFPSLCKGSKGGGEHNSITENIDD